MRWFGLVSLLIASFALQASDPKWIYDGVVEEYRDNRYLTATGEGSSSEDARKNAISRLAEQLKISISSQSNIVKEYRSSSEKFSHDENVNIRIQTQVDLSDLEGITVARQYFQSESNTYFAFALLDKIKNATRLTFQIENQFDLLRTQLALVKDLFAQDADSEAMILLLKTSYVFKDVTRDIELHRLFANTGASSLLKDSVLELITEYDLYLASVFKRIDIRVIGASQRMGSPELGVSEPYRLAFLINGRPLERVPVKVVAESEGSVIDNDDTSNLQGELTVAVRSFPYSDKAQSKISVGLDLYDELFINSSPIAELVIQLSKKSEVSIWLNSSVSSRHNDFLHLTVNDGLSSVLSEQNYNVLSDNTGAADYIIEVQAAVVDMPGFNGINFSKLNGVVSIKSAKTMRVLKTIRIDSNATKAGALTSDNAAEKSAGKLVDAIKDELLSTLEKNLGRE